MALFGKTKSSEGGFMDVIRCDQPDYLVWKWRPEAAEDLDETRDDAEATRQGVHSTVKENAIRYGSTLRVKEGEVAVFVYHQKDGTLQDFIEGPYDGTIKTANFPVLSRVAGAFFGGNSPFQAEIYFINLAGINQTPFGIPYFDVFDPRFPDLAVPVAVRGIITFKLVDYKGFIKLHRLIDFNKEAFRKQIKAGIAGYIQGVVSSLPSEHQIPVLQLTTRILKVKEIAEAYIKPRLESEFGVSVSSVDIEAIEVAKDSEGYERLMNVTQNLTEQTLQAQTDVNIQNMQDTQRINATNMEDMLRIQRKGAELQTEAANFAVHQLNQQAAVAKTAADSLGQMGQGGGMGNGGGFNPAAMMAGVAMGGVAGQQMAGMMGNMMQGVNQPPPGPGMTPPPPPPPPPLIQYNLWVNGQTAGPYTMQQLSQMVQAGQMNRQTMVWKAGMPGWAEAGGVQELSPLFAAPPPPPPPPPAQ